MRYNREKKELTFDEAKDKALRLLEFRSHSERELSDKLKRAGAKEEDIDEILEFCRNYSFLDDRKYAIAKAKDLLCGRATTYKYSSFPSLSHARKNTPSRNR